MISFLICLIGKSLVDVASSMKNENHDVTVYNNITRADHFKEKANEINHYLLKLYMEINIYLIDHSKTLKTQHLNGSIKFLSKIFD